MSEVENKFKEFLFLEGEPKDLKLQLILLIHAINSTSGLKCTGLLEDDPDNEYEIPPGWQNHTDGVFSLRYKNEKSKENLFFKFVTEEKVIDVNAISSKANDKLHSFEIKTDDYKDLTSDAITTLTKKYRAAILDKLVPQEQKKEESKLNTEPIGNAGDSFLWNKPRNDHSHFTNPLGDYGKSDLYPFGSSPFDPNSGGNMVGPKNPLFIGNVKKPKVQFDPYGPGNLDPTEPDPDIFIPTDPFGKKKGPFGGGPFGGGGGFGQGGMFGGGGGFGGGFV